jgi:pilus assembly protein CpaE
MRLLLVSDDHSITERLQSLVYSRGLEFSRNDRFRTSEVASMIEKHSGATSGNGNSLGRDSTIVLVMPADRELGLQAIATICEQLPGRLLVMGPIDDTRLVLRAIRSGAAEYLDQSELESELTFALERSAYRPMNACSVGVFSAGGGSGCSLIAANLAAILASDNTPCALVDLKVEGGDLEALLDLKASYSLSEICDKVESLDEAVLQGCITEHECGLRLLSAATLFPSFNPVDMRGMQRVMSLLSHTNEYIVCDLDRCLSHLTFTIAKSLDHLYCVMRPDFISLRRTRRLLEFLDSSGIARDRVHIIVNRTGNAGEIAAAQIADVLKVSEVQQFPEDPKPVLRSINNGEPLVIRQPSSKLSRKLAALAAGIRQSAQTPVNAISGS